MEILVTFSPQLEYRHTGFGWFVIAVTILKYVAVIVEWSVKGSYFDLGMAKYDIIIRVWVVICYLHR